MSGQGPGGDSGALASELRSRSRERAVHLVSQPTERVSNGEDVLGLIARDGALDPRLDRYAGE